MKALLRKLRGVVSVGLTWGLVFALIMYVIGTVIGIADPDSIDPGEEPYRLAALVGLVGFLSGAVFAIVLSLAEKRKRLLELSPLRAAVWGALGAAALPLLTPMNNGVMLFVCPLGAGLASVTVALARRAERRQAARLTPVSSSSTVRGQTV